MTNSRIELKKSARQLLIGKYTTVIGATLLTMLISYLLMAILYYISPIAFYLPNRPVSLSAFIIFLASVLIISLLAVILSAGSFYLYLNIARGNPYRVSDIFYGFTHQPDRVILLTLRLFLIELLYMLPYIALLILLVLQSKGGEPNPAYLTILDIIFSVILIMVGLRYVLVYYLWIDHPEYSAGELTKESRRLMNGKRWACLKLQLSFFGLILLGLLSLGIGMLWIWPYMNMTLTLFYLDLVQGQSDQWA